MPIPPFPTRTDPSFGRVKSNGVTPTDLNTDTEAGEYNRLADYVIGLATEIGDTTGVTPSSLWQAVLGNAPAAQNHANTANTVANYNLSDETDSGTNSLPLSAFTSTSASHVPGQGCLDVPTAGAQSRPGHDAALAITGALSIAGLAYGGTVGADEFLVTFAGGANTEPTNALYRVGVLSSNRLQFFTESGPGDNQAVVTANNAYSPDTWFHWAVTRNAAGTLVKIFINGFKVLEQSGLVAPTGGSTSQLWVGSAVAGASPFSGKIATLRIDNIELSEAAILADARRTLGR